jgi:hypothetical protein
MRTFISIFLFVFLVGCQNGNTTTTNPTPKDYLKFENADIFLLEGYVFSNAQGLEWVSELDYTLGEQVGEIKKQAKKASYFENGTANKLPIGAKIFDTDTPIYIVIVDGKKIPYLKMVEG